MPAVAQNTISAVRVRNGQERRQEPPERELPACVRNKKGNQKLTNAEWIELLRWAKDCLDDAAIAAGLRK